jgi:lactoylglutathione lyase
LIKLLYNSNSTLVPPPSTVRTSTFANVGVVVPDVQAVQDRLEQWEVGIAKRVGETKLPADGAVANAFNIGPASTSNVTEVEELVKGLVTTDLANLLFAEDPDGNMLEIVARDGF